MRRAHANKTSEWRVSNELKQRMIDGGLWAAGGRLFSIAGAFVLNLVLARSLTPEDYGVYFVVMSTMIILATVGTIGMDRVVVRFVAARKALGDWGDVRAVIHRCLTTVLATSALLCVAFYLLAPWFFSQVVRMPSVVALSGLMVLWLFFSTLQRQLAETFRGLNDIRCATLFGGLRNNGILNSVLTCGAVLALWASGAMSLTAAFATAICASLLVVLMAAWTLWHRLRAVDQPPPGTSLEGWSTVRVLHEGWPFWLASLIAVLRAQASGWFAAGFDTAEQVALFAIAERFALLIIAPLTIVNMLLPPVVAELHARGENKRMGRIVQAVGGLASLPCIVILLLIVLVGRPALGMLFGEHYEAAYPMLVILCIGQVASMATGAWQVVLPMTGLRQQILRVSMSAAVVQFSCSIIGGYTAGVLGVAVGVAAGAVAGNLLGLLAVRRHLSIWTFISMRREVLMDAVTLLTKRIAGLRQARTRDV
jgi:O-antigen/teichoic acid export membrane protein